jgi:serine/threonine protein kinase
MADPERLGKYEIKGALGKGAMGIVYKGFDPQIERNVAIKTIRKDLVEPELADQYMARLRNEAKAAGRLRDPAFRKSAEPDLARHPAWDRIVHPEKYLPKDKPAPRLLSPAKIE